jgi:hypothetical protein
MGVGEGVKTILSDEGEANIIDERMKDSYAETRAGRPINSMVKLRGTWDVAVRGVVKEGHRMDIGRTEGVGGAGRIDGLQKIGKVTPPASADPSNAADRVEFSPHAKITSDALALPSIRADRVSEIKNLIQSGRFDTEARLGQALDRFLLENPDALEE